MYGIVYLKTPSQRNGEEIHNKHTTWYIENKLASVETTHVAE